MRLKASLKDDYHSVNIEYITPRGPWYHYSWKGNLEKSGGILFNIGIHLFDLMIWLFGDVEKYNISSNEREKISGGMRFKKAYVKWFLSIDEGDIPKGESDSYRLIEIDGQPLRFDDVFTDLHTEVYKDILSGGGFGIEDARSSITLLSDMRRKYEIYYP